MRAKDPHYFICIVYIRQVPVSQVVKKFLISFERFTFIDGILQKILVFVWLPSCPAAVAVQNGE